MERGYLTQLALAVATALLSVGATGAQGQSYLSTPDPGYAYHPAGHQVAATEVSSRFDDLAKRVQALEASQTKMAAPSKEKSDWVEAPQKWTSSFGGRLIWDYMNFAEQSPGNMAQYGDMPDYMEFREVRMHFAGTGFGVYDYKLEINIEPSGTGGNNPYVELSEAYLGVSDVPWLGYVKLGQSKTTNGLDWGTSFLHRKFMEQSPVGAFFAAGYRAGLHQRRQFADDTLLLQTFVLFGKDILMSKEYVGDDQGIVVAVRPVWIPVFEAEGRALLHFGGGYQYAKANQRVGIRPSSHEGTRFIDLGLLNNDHFHKGHLEFAAVSGPLSFQSELFAGQFANTELYGSPNAYGAYVQAGWFLTGEHRSYDRAHGYFGRVKPHTNFWLVDTPGGVDAGWGAWEVAARWDYIDFCDFKHNGNLVETAGTLNEALFGVNWWWNPYTKVQFNYIHAMPNTVTSAGTYNASTSNALGLRLQVDF